MDRFVCVHGHFYQPPRENPWLEAIELQDSAYPYHDWNERITAECYAPNATSRILDGENRIVRIVNNYSRISFNVGPTLLSWMEEKSPEVYRAILEADRESRALFSGHGSALAQVYNHMIMPLANRRDRVTQAFWGIRDFQHRFGRFPEGMWLAETAADLETLEVLAELGIRFTVLAPSQACRTRRFGGRWREVGDGRIDPSHPYRLRLPSRRTIDLFFYDGPISRAVAFEGLLEDGERFASRLISGFSESRAGSQLVSIATDGETYGHHRPHGDMALAWALHHIESQGLARLTNYGEYLGEHPPQHEVEIFENSSWSCVHGVERWRSACGCNAGRYPSQSWRGPVREALDGIRDAVALPYEEKARALLTDPWRARDDAIDVVLDRSPESLDRFFGAHAARVLDARERIEALKLLELQRHAMLMYTSCGWFFDEISGIETVQVMQYAGRVLQLSAELFGDALEPRFLETLEKAPSNLPEIGNGREVYERLVRPAIVDLQKVGAHDAIASLFEGYEGKARIYCYEVEREDWRVLEAGRSRLALGRARFTSRITGEAATLESGVLHFGGHNVSGGVREYQGEETYQELVRTITETFSRADIPEVIRLLDSGFGRDVLSLKQLFRDQQRRILGLILDSTLSDAEGVMRQMYGRHVPLMLFLADLGTPLPRVFLATAEFLLNTDLRRAFENEDLDLGKIDLLLSEAERREVVLDAPTLEFALRRRVEAIARAFAGAPEEPSRLEKLHSAVELCLRLPFPVTLWEVQNLFWGVLQRAYPERADRARAGDADAASWVERFTSLGTRLSVRMES
jgi:alpha-amylase/alpha-mannosidase (GH57 family)